MLLFAPCLIQAEIRGHIEPVKNQSAETDPDYFTWTRRAVEGSGRGWSLHFDLLVWVVGEGDCSWRPSDTVKSDLPFHLIVLHEFTNPCWNSPNFLAREAEL